MPTPYDYYNLPEELEVEVLPEELNEAAEAAFLEALASGEVKVQEAKATYVYERKFDMSFDAFSKLERNTSYSSESDDVILQLTIRIPNPSARKDKLGRVAELATSVYEFAAKAAKERLEAEIAQAEQEAENAAATAREKRAKLEELRAK